MSNISDILQGLAALSEGQWQMRGDSRSRQRFATEPEKVQKLLKWMK